MKLSYVYSPILGLASLVFSLGLLAQTNRPALSVQSVVPTETTFTQTLTAQGSLAPWQEAVVSAEFGGARIDKVNVQIGDWVKKDQVLATFNNAQPRIDLEAAKASLAEAQAGLTDAISTYERATKLEGEGFYSKAQLTQVTANLEAAKARFKAAQVRVFSQELHLKETQVLAPVDGVITAKNAVIGAVMQPGAELFRLIRDGRLEWRAELMQQELSQVKAGQRVKIIEGSKVTGGGGAQGDVQGSVSGVVRQVAPNIDPQTRIGLVYVDLAKGAKRNGLRAGNYVKGEIELANSQRAVPSLSLPSTAVLSKDGLSYVFVINQKGNTTTVQQRKVQTGAIKRLDSADAQVIQVLSGIDKNTVVVRSGLAFLADGDSVKLVAGK